MQYVNLDKEVQRGRGIVVVGGAIKENEVIMLTPFVLLAADIYLLECMYDKKGMMTRIFYELLMKAFT